MGPKAVIAITLVIDRNRSRHRANGQLSLRGANPQLDHRHRASTANRFGPVRLCKSTVTKLKWI